MVLFVLRKAVVLHGASTPTRAAVGSQFHYIMMRSFFAAFTLSPSCRHPLGAQLAECALLAAYAVTTCSKPAAAAQLAAQLDAQTAAFLQAGDSMAAQSVDEQQPAISGQAAALKARREWLQQLLS